MEDYGNDNLYFFREEPGCSFAIEVLSEGAPLASAVSQANFFFLFTSLPNTIHLFAPLSFIDFCYYRNSNSPVSFCGDLGNKRGSTFLQRCDS